MKNDYTINARDKLSADLRKKGITDWHKLTAYIKHLPYGRNTNREDFTLVWKEQKGTCSSKHAFLKYVADLNNLTNIELILGMYKMNRVNTPKIGDALSRHGLNYIPEAHCYLKIDGKRYDFTSPNSNFDSIKDDVLVETIIEPKQVAKFKVDFHKAYLKDCIENSDIPFSFEKIWELREACIASLSA